MRVTAQTLRALRDIESRDPDGGTVQPTEAAYRCHELWSLDTYGSHVWTVYQAGGWDDDREV